MDLPRDSSVTVTHVTVTLVTVTLVTVTLVPKPTLHTIHAWVLLRKRIVISVLLALDG